MWRISTAEGRSAWYCGDDPAEIDAMVAELFPSTDVTVTLVAGARDDEP